MAAVYRYDPAAGAQYARSFALSDSVPPDQRLFFCDPDDDCTNFISQCVWAAYGGWAPGFTREITAINASRIKRDIRQVTGVWYGSRSSIGSNVWCRVGEFHDFVLRQKARGPQARQVAEGNFLSVEPREVRAGDVIQMVVASYTPDRYGHGLYVTKPGLRWADVLICCHSIDRLDAPMTVFSLFPDNYRRLRVLRFSDAPFDS